MSVMNIAIIGGVVLLVLLLVKTRRDKGAEKAPRSAKAPKGAKGRGRGRRKHRDAPPAPPEPMPLAAAADAVSPIDESPAPRRPWDEVEQDDWPPAHPAQEPVAAWPPPPGEPPAVPFAGEPFPAEASPDAPVEAPAPPAPVAEEPVPVPSAGPAWPEDEIVTEPGWPLPGEVDGGWSGAAEQPVAAAAGPAWVEQAATAAPVEEVEWLGAETAADEEIPQWTPPAAEEAPAWQPPADEVPEWEAARQGVPEWEAPAAPAAEEPAEEPVAWEPGTDMPSWEPLAHDAEQPTGEFAAPPVEPAEEPVFDEPVFEEPVFDEPVFEELVEAVEEPVFEEPLFEESVAEEAAFEAPPFDVPAFEVPSLEPEQAALVAEAQVAAETAPAAGTAPVIDEPAGEPVAWWDEEDPAVPAGPPSEASSGRWALGGFAAQPGQHALGGVQFREELPAAPAGWAMAPALGAGPGTLVLVLDGVINCDGEGVEVVTDPGFAPTPQGFTLRVAASASGPFAASGTFHVV